MNANTTIAQMEEIAETTSAPTIARKGDNRWMLMGELDIRTLPQAERLLKQWLKEHKSQILDLGDLGRLDTPGALLLCNLRGKGIGLSGIRDEHKALFDLVCGLNRKPLAHTPAVPRWREMIIGIGKSAHEIRHEAYDVIAFVARAANVMGYALTHFHYLRPASISRHVEETGVHALPIIGLMAIMMSVVIGYQGVAQLRPYGGEDFTINLVAVSVLREMGVLLTAIMVAGRSGSAFTAEIGVMKSREEIDALNVMGIDPMQVLVAPRLIALVVTLPLLAFFADIMGLIGGAAVTEAILGISPLQYLDRVRQAVTWSDAFVGLFKAPIFGFLIAVIGCMHGLRVRGSAESVGRETTRAVVKGIFVVLVLDGLFSILFQWLGL